MEAMLLHRQFHRFLWTGIFNTLNGYAWILGIQVITGKPLLANMMGYGIAALIGYVAHSKFTFRQRPSWRSAYGYLVVVCTCYGINLLVLTWSLGFLPAVPSQILAITVFVILSYFGQSRIAFKNNHSEPAQRNAAKVSNHDEELR